jgi:ubiquinone/menaquinone biosynthesis C-methylase UbiE
VGIGTGLNLVHYPADVMLTGIDLSPAMLAIARQRAAALAIDADLRVGDGQDLELEAGQFDTVMATLFLSVVPDPRRAAAEFRRVLKPGGQLLVLDHVRSNIRLGRVVQAALDPLLTRYAGWHVRRDLPRTLASLGFSLEAQRRGRLGMVVELVARNTGRAPQGA